MLKLCVCDDYLILSTVHNNIFYLDSLPASGIRNAGRMVILRDLDLEILFLTKQYPHIPGSSELTIALPHRVSCLCITSKRIWQHRSLVEVKVKAKENNDPICNSTVFVIFSIRCELNEFIISLERLPALFKWRMSLSQWTP